MYEQTWLREDYDLISSLSRHLIPTLVIHGDKDFVPVELASHVAEAVPGAELVVLPACGHFAYLEHPDLVNDAVAEFMQGGSLPGPGRMNDVTTK